MHSSMVHNKLGGLLVKELMSILEVQGLILWHGDDQPWFVNQIFPRPFKLTREYST
jgi:hypothetical protein